MPTCLNFTGTPTQYVPANLRHDTNGWYVVYYEFNPIIDGLERRRIRLNQLRKRCHTSLEFRVQVENLLMTINNQLRTNCMVNTMQQVSITPIPQQQVPNVVQPTAEPVTLSIAQELPSRDNIRYYEPLENVISLFIKEKESELKVNTLRSYKCFCKQFKEWVIKTVPTIKASKFSQMLAVQYMEFVYAGGNSNGKQQQTQRHNAERVTPTTYNNNLKLARALFSWAKEKCYVRENPFDKLKLKKQLAKKRDLIPVEDRTLIYNAFQKKNPAMCIIMQMIYVSMLRPVEITRVQVKQLDFANHCIDMPGSKTKNGKDRCGRMDNALEELLKNHIQGAKPNDYLFADNSWGCGKVPMSSHTFGLTWAKMRDELKLPEEYQLYSLRDSGINNMLEAGVSALDAMQAAGHSDLSMTTRYANHANKNLIDNLNQIAPTLISQ